MSKEVTLKEVIEEMVAEAIKHDAAEMTVTVRPKYAEPYIVQVKLIKKAQRKQRRKASEIN